METCEKSGAMLRDTKIANRCWHSVLSKNVVEQVPGAHCRELVLPKAWHVLEGMRKTKAKDNKGKHEGQGWLLGWLAGWLAGWVAGWLAAGWVAGWLADWLAGCLAAGWLAFEFLCLFFCFSRL